VSHLSWPTGFQPVVSVADRRDALSSLTGWKPVFLPTGFQPVVSVADRRDALSSLTGWKPVLLPKGAKWTVLGGTPALLE